MANLDGLDPTFASKLSALIAATGGSVTITSGYRSPERQAQLFAAAVQKYGSEAAARKWVAPPGDSRHNMGLAADLGGGSAALDLAHQLAPEFGLVFPMDWEPWHIEPMGARNPHAQGSPFTTPSPGDFNSTQDPYKRADVQLFAFGEMLKGKTPDEIDADIRSTFLLGGAGNGTAAAAGSGGGSGDVTPTGPGSLQSSQGRVQWAQDFLTALGKPVTPANITAIVAWQQAESGGGGGANNPLNTTQGGYAGESDLNSVGVKNYANYQDGISANVKVINNGRYQAILDALDKGNDPMAVAQAVAQTPWGTGTGVEKVLGQNPTLIQPTSIPGATGTAGVLNTPPPDSSPDEPRRVRFL